MNIYKTSQTIGIAAVIALFGLAGTVSAQVVSAPAGSVNVTTLPSSAVAAPNSVGMHFATISLSGNGSGTYAVAALPVTVIAASGFSTGNLSNCQIANANGQSLTTGNDVVNAVINGTNTFTFDTPLMVTSATTTLNLSCNVASTALSGATFQFIAGSPVLAPMLGVSLNTVQSVPAGTQNAILAIITLDGSGSGTNTNVTSIPVTVSESGTASSNFTNCALRSASNFSTALNSGTNAVSTLSMSGSPTYFVLSTPFSVPAGSGQLMELTCNVASGTAAGSSLTVSVNPSSIVAANAMSGASISPAASVSNGYSQPVMGTIQIVAPSTTTTLPGAPNTGAGGNAATNIALLALAALASVGAGAFALRRA